VRGPELVELFGLFLGRARAVRRLGSAALDLCYVAAGRFDGFWEQHLKPWDVAAGALVVAEAGGHITGMDGQAFDARAGHLVASNGLVHDAMLEVIGDSRAGRTLHRTV
jgi:myo-inositol-1(or 4)-monophosphatase